MSRGNRSAVSGNLSSSMRTNYSEYGVEEYYKKVASTYQNPHFPGVRACIFLWLNRWWEMECLNIDADGVLLFDMAAGNGEATLAFTEWWRTGKQRHDMQMHCTTGPRSSQLPYQNAQKVVSPPGPDVRSPQIMAADPFTAEAYRSRTSLPCAPLSFRDISEGVLPSELSVLLSTVRPTVDLDEGQLERKLESAPANGWPELTSTIEMIICSFAQNLVETPSELFALLWELSTKARWLIILAPHKKPEIKDGWGWVKWDVESWESRRMTESSGELLSNRVHCRVYRSLNTN